MFSKYIFFSKFSKTLLSSWACLASTDISRDLIVGQHEFRNFIVCLRIIFQKIVGLIENIADVIVVYSTIAVRIKACDSVANLVDVDTLQGCRSKTEEDDEEGHFTFCFVKNLLVEQVDFFF
jgi:hypothetical protein